MSQAVIAVALNADRDRRQEQEAEEAAQEREWRREMERYERQIARENARMGYDLEVARLKTQASVVVAAVERGLADHQNVEYLMSELRSVAKQLENASANASHREKEQAESQGRPTYSERQKRQARPKRGEAETDDGVIEAEVISDGSSDFDARGDAEPEPREEDLGL